MSIDSRNIEMVQGVGYSLENPIFQLTWFMGSWVSVTHNCMSCLLIFVKIASQELAKKKIASQEQNIENFS